MQSKQESNKSKDQLKTFLILKQNGKNTISLQNSKVSDHNQITTNKEIKDVRIQAKQKDKEIQAITSIHQAQQKVKKDLQQMIEEYKNEAEKMMINHGHDPEKQAEIRNHLKKLQQQKKQRRIRFQKDLKRLEKKKQDVNWSSSMNQSQKKQRRKSIEKRIEIIKDRQRKRQEQEASFAKFYSEFKAIKPLHIQLEEEYNLKVEKEDEQKVMRVKKQIKQKVKPMDLQKLSQFEEKYMNNKYEIEKLRLQNKLIEKKREEANFQQLNQLYKGHCHSLVLEELAEKTQKAKYSYQKRKRIKEYSQIVRQEYKPHTVRNSIETQENLSESNTIPQTERGKRVVKDRYLKGQYQGKMVNYQKVPLSHNQQILKGIQYLQFLKSLPKKPKKVELSTLTPEIIPKAEVFKVKRPENPLYRNSRRYKSIDFNFKDGDTQSVRRVMQFMRFRRQQLKDDQKLLKNANPKNRKQWQANQKSYDNQLVNNIEEKLQILKRL